MEINYKVLDKILADLASLGDGQISFGCEEEIKKFLINHDFSVFSDESLKQLQYAFSGSLGEVYASMTGQYLPNIFVKKEF